MAEIITTTRPNPAPPRNLTDPDIVTKPVTASPVAIPIGESSPGNLPPMRIPRPPQWTREEPSSVRAGLGGDDLPGIDQNGAPTPDPRYDPTAGEYAPPPSNLPMTISAAQIAKASEAWMYNVGPAETLPDTPLIAGTKVAASVDGLRRAAGGK